MNLSIPPAALEQFRFIIADRLGLQFAEDRHNFLEDVLQRRVAFHSGSSLREYLQNLACRGQPEEMAALASELTVPETYFFRSAEHSQVLLDTVLPDRIRARTGSRSLALLSAGCASGEEAYSIAILLREHFPELASWEVRVLGLDVNPAMIAKARKGRYCSWSLRDTPADIRARYFRQSGEDYVLDERIRNMVSFEERNLARGAADEFWLSNQFDVVLCRNVLMYLAPDAARELISRITVALVPDGYLFLGYAETLRGLSHDYHLRHGKGAFYYRRRGSREEETNNAWLSPAVPQPLAADGVCSDSRWVEAVRKASERVQHLSEGSCSDEGRARSCEESAAGMARNQAGKALELLRLERYGEALEIVRNMPANFALDPDTELLRAVLLSNCGEPEAAEAVCREVLRTDELNSAAHYLTGLCREQAGDLAGAVEHARTAIYLDGEFAMPHLQLGRLGKRAGDMITARRELRQAESLLRREDASRILLFGGGFPREALIEFSRAECRACGGKL